MDKNLINEPMLEVYIYESSQMLEQLELIILESEKQQAFDVRSVNEVFRIMHTIKGSSSMMLFNNIAVVAHTMEDIFFLIREKKELRLDFGLLSDLVLNGLDFIKVEILKIRNQDDPDGNPDVLIARLNEYLETLRTQLGVGEKIEKPKSNKPKQFYIPQEKKPAPSALNHYKVQVYFQDGCEMENIRAYTLVFSMMEYAKEIHHNPSEVIENEEALNIIRECGFELFIKTEMSTQELTDHLSKTAYVDRYAVEEIDEVAFDESAKKSSEVTVVEPVIRGDETEVVSEATSEEPVVVQSKTDIAGKDTQGHAQTIISVNVEKLDRLMNMVGELVISEAMVTQNPAVDLIESESFHKASRQLHKITTELQDMVMAIRMVPLSTTFIKMNRIVRDMCKKLNKEVELEMVGEETEVDKNIIEKISDPLMHLIRNAIDHGIEGPDERETSRKSAKGHIRLEAKNVGSDVHILIRDDGRGLSRERIIKKAKENGLIVTDLELSDREVFNLILLPGFSTKDQVTEYSGRGVGMDVVSKNIEAVGGAVIVESVEGSGTTITMKIPLTLAIIEGMNIRVGESRYTIPITAIKESFRPGEGDCFNDPDGNEMIMVRGQCYPIVRIHERYAVADSITELSEGILIMVEQDEKTICLFADELLGQQQVVVKPLPNYIKSIRKILGIAGCTLLGDGCISLILDISGLTNLRIR